MVTTQGLVHLEKILHLIVVLFNMDPCQGLNRVCWTERMSVLCAEERDEASLQWEWGMGILYVSLEFHRELGTVLLQVGFQAASVM